VRWMMGECECGETVMSGVVSICNVTADQTLRFSWDKIEDSVMGVMGCGCAARCERNS
jgi:hypothetical protein